MSQAELFAVDKHNEWAVSPIIKQEICIELPKEFLPCIDDWETLRVMADYVDDRGNLPLANLLRWTANEWEWHRGLMRRDCVDRCPIWMRVPGGWSPGNVFAVGKENIVAEYELRTKLINVGSFDITEKITVDYAWWDLTLRTRETERGGFTRQKPKPRKGYKCATNASLAAALCGKALTHSPPLG